MATRGVESERNCRSLEKVAAHGQTLLRKAVGCRDAFSRNAAHTRRNDAAGRWNDAATRWNGVEVRVHLAGLRVGVRIRRLTTQAQRLRRAAARGALAAR